jgi:UDP-N-acetylmuramate dehydrogenase
MKADVLMPTTGQLRRGGISPSAFAPAPRSVRARVGGGAVPPEAGLRGELRRHESMARHVSWRAGGVADCAYAPADIDDLRIFLASLPEHEPVCFVGLGSNLLVRDGGFRGTVIFTHRVLGALRLAGADASEIYAEAGVASPKVARFAALHDLAGAEFLAGIPGTVGGALAMNAGCFGGETWRVVARVETLDRNGRLRERTPGDYSIDYRSVNLKAHASADASEHPSSPIPQRFEEWFVSAVFRLPRGDGRESRRAINELLTRRIATQPLDQPNAGSVFRNPPGDYAARLIEACGLKGYAIGGAVISPKHANFIVNTGRARAGDIEALIERAQAAVQERFGIALEREVRIMGEAGMEGAGA